MSVAAPVIALLLLGASAEPSITQPPQAEESVTTDETPATPAATRAADPVPAPPLVPASEGADDSAIVVSARGKPPRSDPLQSVNATSFQAVQAVDDAIVAPIALGYENKVPQPIRSGLHNLLNNLSEPINFVNYLLQLKPGKAAETLGRFTVNTTVGIGGVIDVAKAKPINLPYRRNGFANTMGFYGVKPGAYLFLPLIGPTTVRDLVGRGLDLTLLPSALGSPFNTPYYSAGTGVLRSVDDRVEMDDLLREFREANDPYAAERTWYLNKREAEIRALKGKSAPAQPAVTATM
ncbi:VacJ family lipoprotein [Novosphingobium sp.]|uniref:MlaA family lipoprotein n=1 Tax=Novosphingobium sp. TaxID=1874826 RepID=UPI002732C618|nr:VacJ family lipoprotein [Novosphingobium sp.]MDP3905860.1 VacJ family lipoprotein [Novosphingobium sp.]